MSVLLLNHYDMPTGSIPSFLEEQHVAHDLVLSGRDSLPEIGEHKAVILLGGPQHLYSIASYPDLQRERDWLVQLIKAQIPVLGICLGAQLLASALGSDVYPMKRRELGSTTVTQTELHDPLFRDLPAILPAFQWHEDTFDLPAGAVLLAKNDHCTNQAFRYRQHVYGLQYHVELNEELFLFWLFQLGLWQELYNLHGARQALHLVGDVLEHMPMYKQQSFHLLERFLQLSDLLPLG